MRGSRHGGAGFSGSWRSQMLFCFTKTLVGGCPRTRNARRASCPWAWSGRCRITGWRGGPRSHRQPFSGSRARLDPVPQPDPPPRGCRVPRPEARNRGYSYLSGGRVRALHAILRPPIPPNRPQKRPEWQREAVFWASGGKGLDGRHRVGQGPLTVGSSRPYRSPAQASLLTVPTRITSAGSSTKMGQRSTAAPATGFGGWSTLPSAAPVAGRKRRGQRGRSPPPASAKGRT